MRLILVSYRIRILLYLDVSCMYPAMVSCMYSEGYMYPLCILMYLKMYLKCPVIFQDNTCILIFCMYFTRIPNESKIHFGIHIRYMYLGRFLGACLGVTLDTCQDT